jgi:hypothetical protein
MGRAGVQPLKKPANDHLRPQIQTLDLGSEFGLQILLDSGHVLNGLQEECQPRHTWGFPVREFP